MGSNHFYVEVKMRKSYIKRFDNSPAPATKSDKLEKSSLSDFFLPLPLVFTSDNL